MNQSDTTMEWRVFGLTATQVTERLGEISAARALPDGCVAVSVTEITAAAVAQELGAYVYSRQADSLAARVVCLLKEYRKTVATAESCTGGLVAAALTDIAGSSQVMGTGLVTYSWASKQQLLAVSADVLEQYGAVSPQVVRQMAQGARRQAGADLAVAITGEAGPSSGEGQPVGTVYVALADQRRSWVKELHLAEEGRDRAGIRRLATAHALDMVRRYLEAYPAVMAGGERYTAHRVSRVIPRGKKSGGHSWLWPLFPRRGDSPRRLAMKIGAWVLTVAVLVSSLWLLYMYLLVPDANRRLQDDLGQLYWGYTDSFNGSLFEENTESQYPPGMMATFRGLYDRNPDIVGWLRVPDTSLDYPVMAYADGYYKSHRFDGQFSRYGQPYVMADIPLSATVSPWVIPVYGRNTGNDQMFSSLLNYRRLAYVRENSIMEFNTLYGTARYEIFAVAVANDRERDTWDYAQTDFADDAAYEDYLAQWQAHSLYRTDGHLTAEDRILVLSTDAEDAYDFNGARLVVAARQLTDHDTVTTYHIHREAILPDAMKRETSARRTTLATTKSTTAAQDGVSTEAPLTTTVTTTTSYTTTNTVDIATTAVEEPLSTTLHKETTTTIPEETPE